MYAENQIPESEKQKSRQTSNLYYYFIYSGVFVARRPCVYGLQIALLWHRARSHS